MFVKNGLSLWGKFDLTANVHFSSIYSQLSDKVKNVNTEFFPQEFLLTLISKEVWMLILKYYLGNNKENLNKFVESFFDFVKLSFDSRDENLYKTLEKIGYMPSMVGLLEKFGQFPFRVLVGSKLNGSTESYKTHLDVLDKEDQAYEKLLELEFSNFAIQEKVERK